MYLPLGNYRHEQLFWNTNWSQPVLVLVLVLVRQSSKTAYKALSFLISSGWNVTGMYLLSNTDRLMYSRHCRIFDLTSHFQDGSHDVISRRKVMPLYEWTWRVWPVSQNEIAPRKTAPGEKHVRPPAEFAAIKSAGGGPVFRPPRKKFAGGRKFLNVQ